MYITSERLDTQKMNLERNAYSFRLKLVQEF
jgi:hypothetical protein